MSIKIQRFWAACLNKLSIISLVANIEWPRKKVDLLLRKPRLYKCVNSPVYMESWEASGAHCPDKAPPPNLAQTTNTFHDTQENAGKQTAFTT